MSIEYVTLKEPCVFYLWHRNLIGLCLTAAPFLAAWTRSFKKEDKSLLNLTGTMSCYSREKIYLCVHKRENSSPLSKCHRGLGVYSMYKTRGRRKMFITMANAASWLTSWSAQSQPLLCCETASWPWVLRILKNRKTLQPTRGLFNFHIVFVFIFKEMLKGLTN